MADRTAAPWRTQCRIWLYRCHQRELEPHEIEMAVPMSPDQMAHKLTAAHKFLSHTLTAPLSGDRHRDTARHYDAHASFQQEVGQALLDLMPDRPVGSELTVCGLDLDTAVYRRGLPDFLPDGLPEPGLDLGCGTGFFLSALQRQMHRLRVKIERERLLMGSLPEVSAQLLDLVRDHGRLTIGDAERLSGQNRNTLKQHFRALVADGHLSLNGAGRGAWYSLR